MLSFLPCTHVFLRKRNFVVEYDALIGRSPLESTPNAAERKSRAERVKKQDVENNKKVTKSFILKR